MEYIKTHKKECIIGGAVIIALIIICLAYNFKHKKVIAPVLENNPVVSTPETVPMQKISNKKSVSTNPETLTYTEAYMKYNHGSILQFDKNCQSHPNNMVITNGSKIMLDNRGDNAEMIKIGDMSYSLDAYGFKIVTVDVSKIPTTYSIDCKFAQNVNTLTIE